MSKHYVNVRFDSIEAPSFFYGEYGGSRKLIGEKHGDYVVQFPTLKQTLKAVSAYEKHLVKMGISKRSSNYAECPYYYGYSNYVLPAKQVSELKDKVCGYFV